MMMMMYDSNYYYLLLQLLLQICSLFIIGSVSQQQQQQQQQQMMTTIQSNNIKMPSLYPPILKVSSHEGYISESAEMGTTVRVSPSPFANSLQITVHDEDLKPGMPPAVYEYILTGLGSSIFAVDQRGYVYLNAPHIDADPPNPSTYQLNVEAREVDTMPIRSSEPVSITIHVMDVNDNPPRFSSSVYVANVSASGTDRPVIQVYATDNDVGKNAQITYQLISVSGGAYNNFRYDSDTRQLIALGNLQAGERYQVILKAIDGGGLSSQAVIIVYAVPDSSRGAIAINQNRPGFGRSQAAGLPSFLPTEPRIVSTTPESIDSSETIQTYVTEISEATPPHSIIVTLGDDSTKGQMYYTITGGNEEKKFAINSETGTLITVNTFDREETALYSLQIETRSLNPDQHLYWTVVQVAIVDVNDNAPTFIDPQPMRLRVKIDDASKLTPNMYLGQVNVEDPDDDDNGRVELRIAPPMDKLFSIDGNGAVTVNGDLLNGHFGEHRMTVIAMDHGDPPLETRAILIINIENALQTISSNSIYLTTASTILENVELTSDNTDRLRNIQFTFGPLLPVSERSLQGIESQHERTRIKGTIPDLVTNELPQVTTGRTTEKQMQRLAPVFDPSEITVIVKENQADIELVKLHAFYMDKKPGSITYVILSGDASLFSINSFTGSLRLIRPLDAEEETSYQIRVGTAEATVLRTEPNLAHTALVVVDVVDVNDWIPNFELNSYQFKVRANAEPGTAIGQVVAYDQDRDEVNNKIRYQIKGSDDGSYFSINPESGLLTVKKDLHPLTNRKISLNIEAQNEGTPKQSSETLTLIDVEPEETAVLPESRSTLAAVPSSSELQFSQRNYSTSLSESVRPPHLLLILPILNKPKDKRFITCSIVSGNFGGIFSISSGPEGNCELRTQMQLDREEVEHYRLNVSVKSEQQMDYAIVQVTVLDANDNAPQFMYNNDEYNGYFAGLPFSAPAFTRLLTVKAEDADLGNSSVVVYSLDPFSLDSKYFVSGQNGEILTKLGVPQIIENSHKRYFDFRVVACDSPVVGQKLCSKANVFVNIISDANRFMLTTLHIQPQQLKAAEGDIAKVLQEYTGPCKLLFVEKMEESLNDIHKDKRVDMYWYAVNPMTKRSCKVQEYSKLFDNSTIKMVAGKLQPRIIVGNIRDNVKVDQSALNEDALFSTNFKTASVAMIVLAVTIAVGALIGICAICLCYTRHRIKKHSRHTYPHINQIPKFGTIFLPSPPTGSSHDMLYETQMLEMPIGEDDGMMKPSSGGIAVAGNGAMHSNGYNMSNGQSCRNYGQNPVTDEGNFSIEESMYAINGQTRIHPESNKKVQRIMIPAPDYPMDQKKSVL